jgi:hypothetical protein
LLAALTAWSARARARAGGGWLPHVGRQVLEGALAALVLGPLLVLVQREAPAWFPPPPVSDALPAAVPRLALVSGSAGTALWEELVFRLGAFGFLLFAARATALYFGAPQRAAALLGTLAATGISALAFAAFHVSPLVAWLGRAGEPFDAARFAWRLLAGAALALVYRWRGLGVAVWAHALFNALLLLGAGPGAFA